MKVTTQPSGAMIVVSDDGVFKYGPEGPVGDRVRAQYEWLVQHQDCDGFFPRVMAESGPTWYVMERLEVQRFTSGNLVDIVDFLLESLSHYVWQNSPQNVYEWNDHITYVLDRLDAAQVHPALRDGFFRLASSFDLKRFQQVDTHGDPTIDNLLVRGNSDIVITDPIPAYSVMPGVVPSDLGKILQSLYGFEYIKGTHDTPYDLRAIEHLLSRLDDELRRAAMYFCAVHYLRLIPYHKSLASEYVEVFSNVVRDGLRLR